VKLQNNIVAKMGIGALIMMAPFAVWASNSNGTPQKSAGAYLSSNYLKEKGFLECKNNCSELSSGYEWAKVNNVCDPKYNKNSSSSYNTGVQAWAWDECAYSDENKPI
jgi:hypothetical protein